MSHRASPNDTICAIATAVGEAAVAILRVSGPDAFAIAQRLAPGFPACPAHRRAYVRRLCRDGAMLDEAVLLAFCAPRSVTGEDVVEVQCHGGRRNTMRVLDALVDAGARVAEPGEFTRRALLAGRLDLTQVEAIADVLHARSEAELRLAHRHLAGELRNRVSSWRERLLELLVRIEAAIDFAGDEHVPSISCDSIDAVLGPLRDEMRQLLTGFDAGRLRYDGVRVVLAGRPNAGKSSLLNALLGTQRAIVTEHAGTTRDSIEESVELGGLLFRLADTAGLRDTDDAIERLGVARSRELAAGADLIVFVVDATTPHDLDGLRAELGREGGLVVWNKTDLAAAAPAPEGPGIIHCCLIRGEGVDALRDAMVTWASARSGDLGDDVLLIGRARHRDAIGAAAAALDRALDAAGAGLPHELIAIDTRSALDAVGQLTGAVTSDEVLDRIFAGFCVGK